MATSIASQLQAIKSFVQTDSEPNKRPFTRPSILFDSKEAADIDIDTIFNIALQGLEVLISFDERFRNYKNNLFSYKSREQDRELMSEEENKRIDSTISSYLKLLSGHFLQPSSLKTLEYLIRRYKIYLHNVEDLILCVLPFHDTHAFVRVVQLLVLGNSKWKFLDGVKTSGAPPPRKVIVQQCVRDCGVLEVLCNHATPSKNFNPARPVVSLCTAVVIEVLGSLSSVEPNVLNIVLLFVKTGLQPGVKGISDQKAGALMIVGLLANKVILVPKLVKSLIRSVSEIAREDARESTDLQSLRLSLMALITIVQLQSVDIPRKVLEILMEIRDLAGILSAISKEFNIDKFLSILLDSLVEYSCSDDLCLCGLISLIETLQMRHLVHNMITKVITSCSKLTSNVKNSSSSNSGTWAKKILITVNKIYPSELHSAVQKFYEDTKLRPKERDSVYEIVCNALDGSWDMSSPISDSKILFALHHPKAEIRRATLSSLSMAGIMKAKRDGLESLLTAQDAIKKLLRDDDLSVVQKAVTLDGLSEILSSSDLLKAFNDVLYRCNGILTSGSSANSNLAADIAIVCLNNVKEYFHDHVDHLRILFSCTFPLLLVFPKTQRLNLKALELAKEMKWSFYQNLASICDTEMAVERGTICSINILVVNGLAESFLLHPEEYSPWLIENCKAYESSKVLFLLVLLQSSVMHKDNGGQFLAFFEYLFPVLKIEWDLFESTKGASIGKFKTEMLDWDCKRFLDRLLYEDRNELNAAALICIFWRLLEAFISSVNANMMLVSEDNNEKWVAVFGDLFVFFATSPFKRVFKEHLHYLVRNFKISSVCLLSRFFTDGGIPASVQVESLHCFAYLCSLSEGSLQVQLLAEFPSILVPLASDDQDTRIAAMNCIEGLFSLLDCANLSSKKNGTNATWSHFLDKLLGLMVEQKRLILSDIKYLPSLLASLLGSSSASFLVPHSIEQRFDKATKEMIFAFILGSAMGLSDCGKLRVLSLFKLMGNAILHVKEVEALLSLLLERRNRYYLEADRSIPNLSSIEVSILCLLLECCATPSSHDGHVFKDYLFKALRLNGSTASDDAIIRPSIAILDKLNDQIFSVMQNEMQEFLFSELVFLFRNTESKVQNATREALIRINITTSTIGQMLDYMLKSEIFTGGLVDKKKKKKLIEQHQFNSPYDMICKKENAFPCLSSILDILLLKKNMACRESLIGRLFKLLGKLSLEDWVNAFPALDEQSTLGVSDISVSSEIVYTRQTILIILEDICFSIMNNTSPQKVHWTNEIDVKILVECARLSKDGITRNHVFSLLSCVAKIIPDKVLEHMLDILTLIGESSVIQIDSHSQHVLEDLIAAVVPCWLSKSENVDKLLQTFINRMPEVAEHRRLKIVEYLLRTLGEWNGLASLLVLLFQSLVSKLPTFENLRGVNSFMSFTHTEWEYGFALHICEQYPCITWLHALAAMFKHIYLDNFCVELLMKLLLATKFSLDKLQGPEFAFRLASEENSDNIQSILGELLEKVVLLAELVDTRIKQCGLPMAIKKEIKDGMQAVLRNVARFMSPSAFFRSILNLLGDNNQSVEKKVLRLLCETVKEHTVVKKSNRKARKEQISGSPWLHMDEKFLELFKEISLKVVHLIDDFTDGFDSSLKVVAVSAVEILANAFPSNHSIISVWLASIAKSVTLSNLAISSSFLRTCAALINVLGPRSLSELPSIMGKVIDVSRDCVVEKTQYGYETPIQSIESKESVMLSVAVTLEAVIEKLGGFLNPYLGDIFELVVLHPHFLLGTDSKLKLKADLIRKLLTEKIPVRLSLPPLLKIFPRAVESGDLSLIITFELLANMVGAMDKSSITVHYTQIFDLCLLALDLRHQHPVSVANIDAVEKSIISSLSCLTLKLTESMFKPLFIRSIEWADSELVDGLVPGSTSIERAISFYGLVNKLAEKHRSLFVPYFKYLLDGCVRHLTNASHVIYTGSIRKGKKAKVHVIGDKTEENGVQSLESWHLRALVLSSLHKCFLYDTGNSFVDSSNFQVLMKPIVAQLASEPPKLLDENRNVPSVKDFDDILVVCIGQMAVAAGSDLLWKPLNHEVLMQTRSDKVRTRILGLRIVKYFLETLKEEYLVLLAETIPFLAELLEDVELSVKSLAQDILKEMESMSGESLRQYL